MAVRTLSWDEYLAEASEARRGVFVEASQRSSQWGFEEFTPQIASRVLLVPEVRLGEEELSALERAARSVGDDHFYFCSEAREPVYCIPFGNYMGYIEAVESGALIPFWNVLHSPRGVWGLDLTSDYGTAAGGSPDFIRALTRGPTSGTVRGVTALRSVRTRPANSGGLTPHMCARSN